MTASCLSCYHARVHDEGVVCRFHDDATVRGGYVCNAWIGQGGQGTSYCCPVSSRHSQQDRCEAQRFESGSYVIPGLSLTVGLPDHE